MRTPHVFRARLVDMIDLRHPLAVLATRMRWQARELTLAPTFAPKERPGITVSVGGFVCRIVAGRERLDEPGRTTAPAAALDAAPAISQARAQSQR